MSDKRFARVANDPRFKKVDRKRRKVKIDSRFERMFNDKTFTTKHFVDKRGAIIGKTSKEDLRQFYDLSDDDKEESQTNDLGDSKKKLKSKTKKDGTELGKKTKKKKEQISSLKTSLEEEEDIENTENISNNDFQNQRTMESSDEDDESSDEDDESSDEDDETSDDSEDERGNKMTVDLARGEGNLESSSSDDDDEEDDEDENDIHKPGSSNYKQDSLQENGGSYDTDTDDEDDFQDDELDHQWAELDHNIHRSSDVTCRLAVCNLDWDKITATDLFVLFSSIKGVVKSVKIYPSEFGLERLKNEECYGPEELREQEENLDDNNVEGSSFSREKLRQYQINRLKYYYAVVECDSEGTSNNVYEEFDGVEYELSGNLIDLRFIPDDMEFQHEPISVATEMPTLATYKPPEFETTALHQTNVKLTWDETDTNRLKTTMKAFSKGDLQDMDFQAYLASSDDEEPSDLVGDDDEDSHSEDEEEKIAKYKKLVQEIDSKEHEDDNDNEMEFTWEPGLKESALDLVAKKRVEKEEKNLTAWDKYLNKKKEKRKERRKKEKEKKLQKNEVSQEEDDEDDIPEGVDMSDPFFSQGFGPDFPDNNNERVKTKSVAKKKGKKQVTEEDKKRKEELELLLMDGKEEPQHFSLKGILENEKKKKKRKKRRKEEEQTAEDHFKVNVEDPRFTALFSSHLYAIDPSDPQFKKTKAMDAIFDERQRRREKKKQVTEELTQNTKPYKRSEGEKSTIDPSLSLLVKSVKSKTGEFNQRRKKQKTAK